MEQLICTVCKTKRELTEEEVRESIATVSKRNLKPDAMLNIWNVFDGETCPEGGMHEYEYNPEFFQKMLDDSQRIRKNNGEITRKNNENKELEIKIDNLKKETETKIKQVLETMEKNKEASTALEKTNNEMKDIILKLSGKEWNSWL